MSCCFHEILSGSYCNTEQPGLKPCLGSTPLRGGFSRRLYWCLPLPLAEGTARTKDPLQAAKLSQSEPPARLCLRPFAPDASAQPGSAAYPEMKAVGGGLSLGGRNLFGRRNKALLKIAGENSFPLALEEKPVREAGARLSWQGGPKRENTELSLVLEVGFVQPLPLVLSCCVVWVFLRLTRAPAHCF